MAASTSWLVMVTPRFARQTRHRIVVKDSNFHSAKHPRKTTPQEKIMLKKRQVIQVVTFFITGSLEVTNQALKGSRFSPSRKGHPAEVPCMFHWAPHPTPQIHFEAPELGEIAAMVFSAEFQKHQAQDTCWHIYNVYVNITCVFKEIEKNYFLAATILKPMSPTWRSMKPLLSQSKVLNTSRKRAWQRKKYHHNRNPLKSSKDGLKWEILKTQTLDNDGQLVKYVYIYIYFIYIYIYIYFIYIMKSYNLLCARTFVCWARTLEG